MGRRGSSKFAQSIFVPKNPEKYIGKGSIRMRSSWETSFASFLDLNDNILEWNSEGIRIPYKHPLKNKMTTYVPDFLIRYRDKKNNVITELIEIKPYGQAVLKEGMNANARATIAVNMAKWSAARKWCAQNGLKFRIITERELFRQ